jgi:hypothetical protein
MESCPIDTTCRELFLKLEKFLLEVFLIHVRLNLSRLEHFHVCLIQLTLTVTHGDMAAAMCGGEESRWRRLGEKFGTTLRNDARQPDITSITGQFDTIQSMWTAEMPDNEWFSEAAHEAGLSFHTAAVRTN